MSLLKSVYEGVFGSHNSQILKQYQKVVEQINALEAEFSVLSDDALKAKTPEFKKRLTEGETVNDILPEAFATVREAAKRVSSMRHFDVQLIGGMALHNGMISEMRTGEGKTLVATLPAYLNALEGKGVHVVTVNDYLARRDAVWMGKIYHFLGLSTGIIQNMRVSYVFDPGLMATTSEALQGEDTQLEVFKVAYDNLRPSSRQEAYLCDITYGTNNEFGFDYLRDNMVQDISEMVMRPGNEMHYAIVDEIDSILVDEARTPLIISAPSGDANDQYYQFAKLVRGLSENVDYNKDEKMRSVNLTEQGIEKFEKWLGIENIYVEAGIRTIHHIEQALKAEVLFKRDKDYVVDADEVMIIDEFTGRKMEGRRYSEGLHQAIEAKENVKIQKESQTLATITFQNLFRMYKKLSGMTGTAQTEEEEFRRIYNLDVLIIPTNKAAARLDHPDRIYKDEVVKFKAVAKKIQECREKKQPILVGTISVEKNERLSNYLNSLGITHEILNAKNHEREGEIIAQAGRPRAVTLATNMAGRGVDIKLGGTPAIEADIETVKNAGGLFVLGTERHEARRIDNQLRGRSGRQGDPGETQFFVSTDDDLMRIFAGDRLKNVMTRLNVPDDMPIEQNMISRILENAQKKVEGHNFDIRKHLLEYDDVLNRHRNVIYKKRKNTLELYDIEIGLTEKPSPKISDEENLEFSLEEKQNEEPVFTSLKDIILNSVENEIEQIVQFHTQTVERDLQVEENSENGAWNIEEICQSVATIYPFTAEDKSEIQRLAQHEDGKLEEVEAKEQIISYLFHRAKEEYTKIEDSIQKLQSDSVEANKIMRSIEKALLLRSIDTLWVEHLINIDYLRTGIGLRGYGQRDPLIEYKREAYQMFQTLLLDIQKEVVYAFYKVHHGIELVPTIMASDTLVQEGTSEVSHNATDARARSEGKKHESKKDRRKRQRMERGA